MYHKLVLCVHTVSLQDHTATTPDGIEPATKEEVRASTLVVASTFWLFIRAESKEQSAWAPNQQMMEVIKFDTLSPLIVSTLVKILESDSITKDEF